MTQNAKNNNHHLHGVQVGNYKDKYSAIFFSEWGSIYAVDKAVQLFV